MEVENVNAEMQEETPTKHEGEDTKEPEPSSEIPTEIPTEISTTEDFQVTDNGVEPENTDMVVETDNSEEQTNDDGGNELVEGVEMKDVSVPEEITECKVEDSKEESITEVNGKEDDNFLADITLGTESPGEVVEANGDIEGETGDTDKKYSDIDAVRRVLIKSIDRKKTADDIEDYFFDNYSDCGIEDVFTCYLPGKKKWFNGAAIVTFENEAQAQKFMKMDFRKEETIGFRQKLYKICLADNKKKREERLKKFNEQKKKPEVNGAEVAKASCTIACVGFSGKMKGVADLQSYMQENHENVADIQIDQEKTLITFADQRSADRFLGLTYVKFKGAYIHRRYSEEVKRGEKRKHESTTEQQGGYQGAVKGAQFKLRGFKSSGTTYTVIKQGLEGVGVDKKDVKFVNYDVAQMEAVVRLQSNKAREVVMMLNKAGLTINGDRVSAQVLAGAEEDLYLSEIGKVRWDAKHKREFRPKKNDWSDY